MPIGSVRLCDQLGSNISGKRAARSRTMRKLSLPLPITIVACSSMVGMRPARSVSPVISRLWR